MGLNLKEVHAITKFVGNAGADISINVNKIVKYEEVLAYDEFSLIVDLESALGLLLGLSALSIFDSIFEIVVAVIQNIYKK